MGMVNIVLQLFSKSHLRNGRNCALCDGEVVPANNMLVTKTGIH